MTKQPPKAQRVGVFVDVQNMYYSARYMYNAKVNFKALLQEALRNRIFVRAIAYVIRTEDISREQFFDALENIGYEIKAKDIQVFVDGSKKGDWDIGIAMDMIEMAPRLDTLVLVSGDGDFVPLVEHLQRALGCRVEVIAFGKSASGKLKEAANDFIDLDSAPKKFLISRKPQARMPEGQLETHHEGVGKSARGHER